MIDTIVAEVQSVPGDDRCVLLLGYGDQLEQMFQNVNPGLARRFPMSAAFEFEDFDDTALLAILNLKLKDRGFTATDEAKRVAIEILNRARSRPNFGNAGEIDILLADAQRRHQKRQAASSVLEAADIDPNHDRAMSTDTNVAMLFAGEVGREAVIATLTGYQGHVRACKDLGLDPNEDIPFGFLFRGPPGTGKTTTARKMGKIYYDTGFLADATVVECSTSAIIGEYIGQTAPKVRQMMDKALGRVLFIDEAYRLGDGHFSKEALDELVDCLTKERYAKKLIVILAGYNTEINQLLGANPGLSSRFPAAIDFANLSPADCWNLLQSQLRQQKDKMDSGGRAKVDLTVLGYVGPDVERDLLDRFQRLSKVEGWGNARDVKTLASGVFRRMVRNRRGTGPLVLDMMHVTEELDTMLNERLNRAATGATVNVGNLVPQSMQMRQASSNPPPRVPMAQSTDIEMVQESNSEADEVEAPMTEAPSHNHDDPRIAKRDAGVSDAIWEQL